MQLVVEFYIYSFWLSHSQIKKTNKKKKLPTPQQVPHPRARHYRLCLRLQVSSHWQKQQTFLFCAFFLRFGKSVWHQVYSIFFSVAQRWRFGGGVKLDVITFQKGGECCFISHSSTKTELKLWITMYEYGAEITLRPITQVRDS